jgi:hypothetical protein
MPAEQQCVFCGRLCRHTRDHVPPKGLWAKPRPQLITVPACTDCNANANLDDEFMQRMAMTSGAERNEDARQVGGKILRAMSRPEKRHMRQGFIKTLTPVDVFTPMGLYAGRGLKMQLDGDRLNRIVAKVTMGMLWDATRQRMKATKAPGFSEADVPRLPANYNVFVHPFGAGPDHEVFRENQRHIIELPYLEIGRGTFTYRYMITPDDPFTSIWCFTFYGGVYGFMGYTMLDGGEKVRLFAIQDKPPEEGEAVAG